VGGLEGVDAMNVEVLFRSKTFWTGVTGIVAAAGGYATGEIEAGAALQTVLTALIGIFLRDAVAKVQ